jgi:hypothetical protein
MRKSTRERKQVEFYKPSVELDKTDASSVGSADENEDNDEKEVEMDLYNKKKSEVTPKVIIKF